MTTATETQADNLNTWREQATNMTEAQLVQAAEILLKQATTENTTLIGIFANEWCARQVNK